MLFYILLVFLPMIIFIQWNTQALIHDRLAEIRNEKQQLLNQSVHMLTNQLLETEIISSRLQSNPSLIKFLRNRYTTASDEIFSYLTDILPTIKSIASLYPSIDETFLYRYVNSALKESDIIYYIVNVRDFNYDDNILIQAKKNGFIWFVEMNPAITRHNRYNTATNASQSPKLIYITRLYDERFTKIIGYAELQVNLDKLMQSMNFLPSDETLYMKIDQSYYQIIFNSNKSVQYKLQNSIPVNGTDGFGITNLNLSGTNIEFVYQYRDTGKGNSVLFNSMLKAAMLLIIPTFLLLLYIYHFTGRLSKFSNHIKLMHGKNLIQYDGGTSRDEFGIVIAEYNRMTKAITSLIKSVYIAEQRKNEANYYAMQSQVNPHFLFNTLENIRISVDMKEYSNVSDMLFALSRLLRYNISMRRESTLLSEIEHIRHYLLIYQYRFKDRINFTIDIPAEFQDIKCPFCILQPIVENCFKHGLKDPKSTLSLTITLKNGKDTIILEIRDNGVGMTDIQLETINKSLAEDLEIKTSGEIGSVGLKNVNSRLRIFYGKQFGISFSKNKPCGIICRIQLGRHALVDLSTILHLDTDEDTTNHL